MKCVLPLLPPQRELGALVHGASNLNLQPEERVRGNEQELAAT
jgi:hypothetical protein